jgi:hypothetical protein
MKDENLINKVSSTLEKVKSQDLKFIFIVPSAEMVSAEVYEIYNNAYVLFKNGYNVHILLESAEDEKPYYVDPEILKSLPHTSIDKANIVVNP